MEKNIKKSNRYKMNDGGDFIDIRSMDLLIPNKYLHDDNLEAIHEKILAIISIFNYSEKGCRLEDKHFSNYMKISERSVSRIIEKLCKENYIRFKVDGGRRTIYILE